MLLNRCYLLKLCFDCIREASFAKIQKKYKDVKIMNFGDETENFDLKNPIFEKKASFSKCGSAKYAESRRPSCLIYNRNFVTKSWIFSYIWWDTKWYRIGEK